MKTDQQRLGVEVLNPDYFAADAAWNRGWTAGVLTGTLVTTFLLGGGIAFVLWTEWLRWCA